VWGALLRLEGLKFYRAKAGRRAQWFLGRGSEPIL